MIDFLGSAGLPIDTVLFGNGQTAQETRRLLQQVALTDLSILLEGESGTGKETVARWIHGQSPFAKGEFVRLSASALGLAEMEESHESNSCLPVAVAQEMEHASGGTLFLDEVEELSPVCQARLLAVLQEKNFIANAVHEGAPRDTRVISSVRVGPRHVDAKTTLRPDLYYSVSAVTFRIPPLRERIDELPMLAEYFITQMSSEYRLPARPLSSEALKVMVEYAWPGNLRELRDILTSYVLTASEEMLVKKLTTTTASAQNRAA